MITVSGRKNFPVDRLALRLSILFKEVLLQSRVRQKRLPGLAHTLIFFGFIAVLPHTIELMIAGIFPGFSFASIVPGIYVRYALLADILALLTLVLPAVCGLIVTFFICYFFLFPALFPTPNDVLHINWFLKPFLQPNDKLPVIIAYKWKEGRK